MDVHRANASSAGTSTAGAFRRVGAVGQHWRHASTAITNRHPRTEHGGARALLRAAGVAREDFGKPIIVVANSFTEFVPGHTHLQPVGRIVADAVRAAGGVPREFHTIAVDDGIALGHGGMLYSLPSRDLIADAGHPRRPARAL